ncbi:MAG TPA: outer membrane beta-barrel protein [Smithellaceae bacterium]|nr:outer membrane beta-barrel protein [Smithellaceae bacterium]
MKKAVFFAVALAFILSVSVQSYAQVPKGLYAGVTGGFSVAEDMSSSVTNRFQAWDSIRFDTSLKAGYLFGAKVGWQTPFTDRIMALELELLNMGHEMDTAKSLLYYPESSVDGRVFISSLMTNVIARYPKGKVHPYVGIGGGLAYMAFDEIKNGYPPFWINSGSDVVLAYQLMAGVEIDIAKNFVLGVGYKYFDAMKATYESDFGGPGTYVPAEVEMDYKSHNFMLSFSYLF